MRASVRQTAPARPPSPSAAPWPRLQPPKTKTMAEASTDPRGGGRSPLRGYTEPLSPRGPLPHAREGTSFRHPGWKALPAWSSEVPRAWSWTADGGRRVLGLVGEPPLAQRRLDCLLGALLSQTGLAGGGFWKAGLLRGGGAAGGWAGRAFKRCDLGWGVGAGCVPCGALSLRSLLLPPFFPQALSLGTPCAGPV